MIREKDKVLIYDNNALLPEDSQITLRLHLYGCDMSTSLESMPKKLHGETGDSEEEAVAFELPALRTLFQSHSHDGIWNADKIVLKNAMFPDSTISSRLTVGEIIFFLMFIANHVRPRCS